MYLKEIKVSDIIIGKYKLRFKTGKKDIDDLAISINLHNLICPLIVVKRGDKYELHSGHRRLEAIKKLGWEKILVIIKEKIKEKDMVVQALVENIERLDLTPLERAKAYEEMIKELNITQEQVSSRTGRSRSEIANHLRLLKRLNIYILDWLQEEKISFGHAKVLMEVEDKKKQLEICKEVIDKQLSIIDTALLVDQARPIGELTEREKELNKIERDIIKSLKNEWRKKINIRQGKKEEKLMVSFKDRKELKNLLLRLSKAL